MHTGPGTQHNHYYYHPPRDPGPSPFRPLAVDHLEWLARRFVAPAGMAAEQERLKKLGTLLVDGVPGSGRNATARMLLHGIGSTPAPRQLLAEDDDASLDLPDDQVGEGDRLLLDLTNADDSLWKVVHEKLPSLHQAVRERGAHLVVVLPHGSRRLSTELDAHRYTVVRPDGMLVLMRALRAEEPRLVESRDELTDAVRAYVATAPPLRDIGRLARLMAESRRVKPRAGVPVWCADALTSLRDVSGHVADLVGGLSEGSQRALLLTAAMLPGSRTGAVQAVNQLLLETVGHPADERPLLDQEDLLPRVEQVEASVRPDGSVVFELPDLAPAVRSHFWTHRPDLWGAFRTWVEGSVHLPALDSGDRDSLVAGYAEQALRTGQRGQLLGLAREWSKQDDPRLVQATVQALGLGLSDPHAGREFRRQVYDWSRETGIPIGLARALVAVSAGVIAYSHPDQALVRLHHLARRPDAGRTDAADRLLRLGLSDERLHRKLLRRLAEDLERNRWPADARLFRACASPDRVTTRHEARPALLDRSEVRRDLVSSWRGLFSASDTAEWLPQAEEWLAAAHPAHPNGEALLDVLVQAAADSPAVLARLYVTSLRYPCSTRLRRKVDAVQGVGPASSSS
ncbi:hypothetical protein [Streptomyces sp. NPDC004267]|uniref:hypothetical protein n=1 Tax=Streptomyces sp. NPDC004267 TaxID=3364694 RepID=UPI00368EB1DA